MTFEDLAGVVVLERGGCGLGDFKEQVYANGEVRTVKKTCFGGSDEFPQAGKLVIPTGGADDDVLSSADAGFGVRDDCGGSCEINSGIERGEELGRESACSGVVILVKRFDVMTALTGHVCHERTGFATT